MQNLLLLRANGIYCARQRPRTTQTRPDLIWFSSGLSPGGNLIARIKRKSAVLEAARKRLAGLKAIDPKPNFGTNLPEETYTAKITSLSNRLDGYNTMLSEVDEAQNELDREENETNDLNRRFLSAGEAQYGPDSNEYEMLGGTRTSDRKKPGKKSGGSSGTGSST